jgi:hemin uptake protein HemP
MTMLGAEQQIMNGHSLLIPSLFVLLLHPGQQLLLGLPLIVMDYNTLVSTRIGKLWLVRLVAFL